MRIIDAFRFLLNFILIAILCFFYCILYGTNKTLVLLRNNGVIITNDEKLRNNE